MDLLWNDLRYAFRTLSRNPGFTAVVLATLALGIGANSAIYGLMDQVLLRPLPVDRPGERALRMALALQDAFTPISEAWAKLGHRVGLGIGVAQGEATLGIIGSEQRWEYAAIGNVPNLAARLCGVAQAGEIILDAQTEQDVGPLAETEQLGPLQLRGFAHPIVAFRLRALR